MSDKVVYRDEQEIESKRLTFVIKQKIKKMLIARITS